jgi:hypothetical protein
MDKRLEEQREEMEWKQTETTNDGTRRHLIKQKRTAEQIAKETTASITPKTMKDEHPSAH